MSLFKLKLWLARTPLRLGLILLAVLLVMAGCSDGKSRVIFDNQSACGTIKATLTNSKTGVANKVDIPIGQRVEVIVDPNEFYNYVVDFTAAGRTGDNQRCVAVESGQVSVPAGASQTFALRAETPTPSSYTATP